MRKAILALALAACAVEEPLGGSDEDLAGQEAYESDGKSDAAFDALSAELTAKYGLRPRKYNGFFNDSNEAETRFHAALPKVTAAMNTRAVANGATFRFTQAELATNFITEGGYYLLEIGIHDSGQTITWMGQTGQITIDGFTFLGTDTIVDNATAVSPWLSPELRILVNDPARQLEVQNEKGETVHTIYVDTIEQGLELNAAMFAWSRQLAAAAVKRQGKDFATLAPEARFFWTTVWFNAGPTFGAAQLDKEGVSWWQKKWTSGDDLTFSRYARYNALWRTSSWELLSKTTLTQ